MIRSIEQHRRIVIDSISIDLVQVFNNGIQLQTHSNVAIVMIEKSKWIDSLFYDSQCGRTD